jgi:DNA mismatch repair protein MutH
MEFFLRTIGTPNKIFVTHRDELGVILNALGVSSVGAPVPETSPVFVKVGLMLARDDITWVPNHVDDVELRINAQKWTNDQNILRGFA